MGEKETKPTACGASSLDYTTGALHWEKSFFGNSLLFQNTTKTLGLDPFNHIFPNV